jgi:hypothetical protein
LDIGDGVGVGDEVAVGRGVGEGVREGVGDGDGVKVGLGVGVGEGRYWISDIGEGVAVGEGGRVYWVLARAVRMTITPASRIAINFQLPTSNVQSLISNLQSPISRIDVLHQRRAVLGYP